MRREGILCLVLLTGTAVRAEVPVPEPVELKAELSQLRQERDALEARIRALGDQLTEARAVALSARTQAESLELRCRQLQEDLKLARAGRPEAIPPAAKLVNERELPPPRPTGRPAVARGKITAVGRDGRLMQVSVGQDAGLKAGQVIEVFRLGGADSKPRVPPIYLGTLKLVRVDPQFALGEFQGFPGLDRRPRAGDDVASELSAR